MFDLVTLPCSSWRVTATHSGSGYSQKNLRVTARSVSTAPSSYPAYTPIPTYFNTRYSSMPSAPPSRPNPDCLTPPNGAAGFDGTP
jgi:hypothetical protein